MIIEKQFLYRSQFKILWLILLINLLFQIKLSAQIDTLIVGCDYNYPPYSYLDKDGNVAGYDIDVINSICEISKIPVVYKSGEWSEVLNMLLNNEIDVIASIVYSESREKIYDFSFPLHTEYYAIFSNANCEINDVSDLKKFKPAVLNGDISNELFLKPIGLFENYILSKSIPEALEKVNNEIADYTIAPYPLGMGVVEENDLENIYITGPPIIPSVYCLGVKEGNSRILSFVNRGIQEITYNGKLDEIYKKWIKYKREDDKYEVFFQYSLAIIAGLILVSLLLFLFFYSLKKQVQKKTVLIKKTEATYKKVYNSVNSPMFIVNYKGQLIDVNDAGIKFYNLENTDYSKLYALDLVSSGNSHLYHQLFSELKTKGFGNIEANRPLENGENVFLQIRGSKIDFAGEDRYLIVYKDVTEDKITLQKTEDAKRVAESANSIKSRFLASISHEIRTPLTAILGFANLLSKSSLNKKQSVHINKIILAGDILLNLVNDVLDITKIEAKKIVLQKKPFLLKDIIYSIIEIEQIKSKNRLVSVECSISDKVPEVVFGDKVRVTQVLMNVITNAIKFTPKGKVSIYVGEDSIVSTKSSGTKQLFFIVRDTGIGIPEDIHEKIFEPFEQMYNKSNRKYEGSGLGLAISKQLIELMGGAISFKSEEGKGTEFRIEIPFKYGSVNEVATNGNTFSKDFFNETIKILLVEDNMFNAEILIEQLNEFKISIDHANSGFEALSLLKNNNYDLVLLDIEMPEMDGFDTMEQIKRMEFDPIPVIALTAHALDSEKEKALELGMYDYLHKPLKPEELLHNIQKAILAYRNMNDFTPKAISYEKGIVFFGNNEKLYQRALIRFKDTYHVVAQKLLVMDANNASDIKDIIHNLKSGSEMIGAQDLFQLTQKYDSEFKADDLNVTKDKIIQVSNELTRVLDEI